MPIGLPLYFFLLACLFGLVMVQSSTHIEDHMETQNDPRLPSQFKTFSYLSVRQYAFNNFTVHHADGTTSVTLVPNWELFAYGYWYEYREAGMECPMTPSGIAATCDWALMVPCIFGNISKAPKTIFVHQLMLPHFFESTLRFMDPSYKFVLVSGGTDQTIPTGLGDVRYRRHPLRGFGSADGGPYWHGLVDSPQVLHWFAENHDLEHPKVSSLPTGIANDNPDRMSFSETTTVPLHARKLMVLSADRTRDKWGQWYKRGQVAEWCMNSTSFCFKPSQQGEGETHSAFIDHLTSHVFIACVQGGGLDPSPKAWEAMLAGTIPIIEKSTVSDGYEEFPVVIVDKWEDLFFAKDPKALLQQWYSKLAPYYEPSSKLRAQVIEKLHTPYWARKFRRIHYLASRNMTAALGIATGKNKLAVPSDDFWTDNIWSR